MLFFLAVVLSSESGQVGVIDEGKNATAGSNRRQQQQCVTFPFLLFPSPALSLCSRSIINFNRTIEVLIMLST